MAEPKPNIYDNMVKDINAIKIPFISDKPKTPSNKKRLEKFAKDVVADINVVTEKLTKASTDMNCDMCKKLEKIIKLATLPDLTLSGIGDYVKEVVNFFLGQYNNIIAAQIELVTEVQKVVTALNNKIAEITQFFCSNEEFEFPTIIPPNITLGCDITLPELPDLELDLNPIDSPVSLTTTPICCEVPPEE